jgi:hypothetical protein
VFHFCLLAPSVLFRPDYLSKTVNFSLCHFFPSLLHAIFFILFKKLITLTLLGEEINQEINKVPPYALLLSDVGPDILFGALIYCPAFSRCLTPSFIPLERST